MANIKTPAKAPLSFVLSEAPDWYSRDTMVVTGPVAPGTTLKVSGSTVMALAGTEGETAVGIACYPVASGEAKEITVLTRHAEVSGQSLVYYADTTAAKTATATGLKALGIIVR